MDEMQDQDELELFQKEYSKLKEKFPNILLYSDLDGYVWAFVGSKKVCLD